MAKKRKKSGNPATRSKPTALRDISSWEDGGSDSDFGDGAEGLVSVASRFPTPADAAREAALTGPVEWREGGDGSVMRHRVYVGDAGPVVEHAIFLEGVLASAVCCAWFQSQGTDEAGSRTLAALDQLYGILIPALEADIRTFDPTYEAKNFTAFFEEPTGASSGFPVFGWRFIRPVSEVDSWELTRDAGAWNFGMCFSGYGAPDEVASALEPDAVVDLLRRNGLEAVLCHECQQPVTDQQPQWRGIWTTPIPETGPLCTPTRSTNSFDDRYELRDEDFGVQHRPLQVGSAST